LTIPGKNRDLSFEQVIKNMTSILVDSKDDGDLSGTKEWRLNWWGDIIDYTFGGRYFWTGKGFGINLADDDGYQGTDWQGKLRSPHNGHLTILARAGVPGFFLWIVIQGTWLISIVMAYRQSRRRGDEQWASLFMFLMGYWLALMSNTAFDVYLEGPMGGVWFWTVFGTGLAATWIYRHRPDALDGIEDWVHHQPAPAHATAAGRMPAR
jgi:hypothetical protein